MDDTWAARDNATGALIGAPEKFPSGIPSLVEHVHGLKLAFGIYTDVGHQTCANRPGSWGHETLDAETFAKWQVDLVNQTPATRPWIPSLGDRRTARPATRGTRSLPRR